MTYQEAESFLFNKLQSFQDKGRSAFNANLDNALALSELLGHPHKKFKSVHIAGTNGKGSVSHIVAAGLQAHGYKVGLYTSPHYKNYRERIKINGSLIPENDVVRFIEAYQEDILRIKPSFFEITCAMAFDYFAKENVDVAIIEVGLGGRLDSTNILTPLLSVVTNISFDHQSILGNSLEEIAMEKAGIFKPNVPIVIGEKQSEVEKVFINKARDTNSQITFAEDISRIKVIRNVPAKKIDFCINDSEWHVTFPTHLTSSFQIKNLRTGLTALYLLKNIFELSPNLIAEGIKDINRLTYFIGRWSRMKSEPTVIFDSAHNVAGVKHLASQIKEMDYNNLRIVWGTTREKDVEHILTILPRSATYYFCQADNSRAMDVEVLRLKAQAFGLEGYSYRSVAAAYRVALAEATKDDLVLVAGSTFVVAEVV